MRGREKKKKKKEAKIQDKSQKSAGVVSCPSYVGEIATCGSLLM